MRVKGQRTEQGRGGTLTRAAMPLALLCLVLQLGSATHFMLASHSICLEHGEVVDGPATGHAAAVALPAGRAGRLSAPTGDVDAAIHEHDHCLLAQDRRDHANLPRSAVRVAALPTTARACLSAQLAVSHSSVTLILVAPKSSPPIVPIV